MTNDTFLALFLGDFNQYVTNFQWDVAKYPLIKQTTLRNIAEIISKVLLWLKMFKKIFACMHDDCGCQMGMLS